MTTERDQRGRGARQESTHPPFTSRVDDPVTKHQSTSTTYKISTAEFLNDVGVGVPAVRTYQADGEVRTKDRLLRLRGRSKWKGLSICHCLDAMQPLAMMWVECLSVDELKDESIYWRKVLGPVEDAVCRYEGSIHGRKYVSDSS